MNIIVQLQPHQIILNYSQQIPICLYIDETGNVIVAQAKEGTSQTNYTNFVE